MIPATQYIKFVDKTIYRLTLQCWFLDQDSSAENDINNNRFKHPVSCRLQIAIHLCQSLNMLRLLSMSVCLSICCYTTMMLFCGQISTVTFKLVKPIILCDWSRLLIFFIIYYTNHHCQRDVMFLKIVWIFNNVGFGESWQQFAELFVIFRYFFFQHIPERRHPIHTR